MVDNGFYVQRFRVVENVKEVVDIVKELSKLMVKRIN